MISIIVAIDKNNAIGKNGDLLCHLPADLKHFKDVTAGHTVIMGRRTYYSLPINKITGNHSLPNRRNIVVSDVPFEQFDGAETVTSIDAAISAISKDEEAFVIGGGMIYKQFEPLADKLYITHIQHTFDGADTFFPKIETSCWKLTSPLSEYHKADEKNPYDYMFAEYLRKDKEI